MRRDPRPALTVAREDRAFGRARLAAAAQGGYSGAMTRAGIPFIALLIAAFATAPAVAELDRAPKVHPRLVAEQNEIAPGKTVTVALVEDIREGWHTYWINPGEAGQPTEIQWTLPAGWKAGPIQWPYPKRIPTGPLMDYGYEGKPWLLVDITAPPNATPGQVVTLHAAATWLVCKEVCIPEDATLSLSLGVSASPQTPYATTAELFNAARAKLPTASPWPIVFRAGGPLDLFIASPRLSAAQLRDASFFPLEQGDIVGMAPQRFAPARGGLVLQLAAGKKASALKTLEGVVVLTSADGSVQALDVKAAPGAVPSANFADDDGNDIGLALALLFALAGGLILNLMPCVLPILAMKALSVASKAGADKREAAREGMAYGAGAILSFAALGMAVILLRASGAAVGWGFQLQEPAAVGGFALLIFAVGLNLSGVFELAGGIDAGDALTRKGGAIGAFFTGVLAVAVAAPCTAPFMAAALGFALTQSAVSALAIFVALGIGFAAPFVIVGVSPRLLRLLPKPGAWMLRFKQLLAFPMYGAAAWLVWVLAQESGPQGLVLALVGMLALAFAAWVWDSSRAAQAHWRSIGAIAAALALLGALSTLVFLEQALPAAAAQSMASDGIPSEPYSEARLAQLRTQQRPVFVDATAAWCITCLVNEKVALSSAEVRAAFAQKHVALLIADWTRRDAAITSLLDAHGRSGVPLYLYYPPGASDAQVLPQVLTPDTVLAAVSKAAGS
ncbi:MAG: thioredoxin family protein [Rhizomicrobium sp.]